MERTRESAQDKSVVAVSHGNPIKSAVMHYIGLHIDMYDRFEISNASVTTIVVGSGKPGIVTLNNVVFCLDSNPGGSHGPTL